MDLACLAVRREAPSPSGRVLGDVAARDFIEPDRGLSSVSGCAFLSWEEPVNCQTHLPPKHLPRRRFLHILRLHRPLTSRMRTRDAKDLAILPIGLETPRFHLRLDTFLQTRRTGVDQVLAVRARVAVRELRRDALDVASVAEEALVLVCLPTFGGGRHFGRVGILVLNQLYKVWQGCCCHTNEKVAL